MSDYLATIFLLYFSVGLVVTVYLVVRWRDRVYARKGHLFIITPALMVLSFFFFSRGVGSSTLSQAAPALVLGGTTLVGALFLQLFAVFRFLQAGDAVQSEGAN